MGLLERSAEGGFGFGIAARSGSAALFVSILIISDCMTEHDAPFSIGHFEQDQRLPSDQNQPRAPNSLLLKTGRQ
jgi:hypothetical protein